MQTADVSNLFQSDAHHARASYRVAKAALHAAEAAPRVVQTSTGAVRGELEYGYRTFEGIPYATALPAS